MAAGSAAARPAAALAAACALAAGAAATAAGRPALRRPAALPLGAPVLQEPRVQDFFHALQNYTEVPLAEFAAGSAPPVLRVADLDDETLQQLIRDGAVFVVDDCQRGFDDDAVSNFQCKDFAKRWPSGNMRAEYTPGQYHIRLRDTTWYSKVEPQRANREHMAGAQPIAGPYIWHVKDEEPLKTKRQVQRHWRTPYFLQKSFANRMEANESFEFWFSMAGGGTFTHADAYCESTISMQFSGTKRWRVQAFPRVRHFLNASSFGDEQIYDRKLHTPWAPETEFAVGPGQCVVFPTGYLHETFVDPRDNDNGCYTASTFQFNHPRQVNLYRAYMSSFSMSHYGMGEPCVRNIAAYATLLSRADFEARPRRDAMRKEADRLMRHIDGASGDQRITRDELYAAFCTGQTQRRRLMDAGGFRYPWVRGLSKAQHAELEEEAMGVWAEDALQYHDIDRDGAISLDELAHNLLHWNVVSWRLEAVRATARAGRDTAAWVRTAVDQEAATLREHFCANSAECPAADELLAYGKHIGGCKRRRAAKMRGVLGMFEGDGPAEGDEGITLVDRATGAADTVRARDLQAEL